MKPGVRKKSQLLTHFIAWKLCLVLTKGQLTLPALQIKSVKIVFAALMQDEWNRVKYMDYISINDENSTSQQYQTKTVLEMHRHNCGLRTGAICFTFFRRSGRGARARVTSRFLLLTWKNAEKKKTPVLQANLMANLQSEKIALQPGKKITCLIWH